MMDYLKEETGFLRGLQVRFLLLLLLCGLTRSGSASGSDFGVLGVSVDINQGLIIVAGPIVCVLLQMGSQAEGRNLKFLRQLVTTKIKEAKNETRIYLWTAYMLFWFPTLAAAFLTLQYYTNLVPLDAGCSFERWRHLIDFSIGGTPSMFCMGDIKEGMPWIYSPYQIWLYLLIVAWSIRVGWIMRRDWLDSRIETF